MPTKYAPEHPFTPGGPLTRAELEAYLNGRLPPAEQQRVELHLEADPLLRDAAEGLAQNGALAGLAALRDRRPVRSWSWRWWIAGALAAAVTALLIMVPIRPAPEGAPVPHPEAAAPRIEQMVLAATEIEAAQEQPESLRIGHEPTALHRRTADQSAVARDGGIEPLPARPPAMERGPEASGPLSSGRSRPSLRLLFLHDLKVVDPRELYATDPTLTLADAHVAARFADQRAQQQAREESITLSYTVFMDEALARFARNDHKGCLDDLRFLMEQYPDDVNALFYAGLCSYNLGLYGRARTLLHHAATHPVPVFDEEAAWYHALSLEQLGEAAAAQEAFGRIAAGRGFYADRAAARRGPDARP